jgi:hypothetical protein
MVAGTPSSARDLFVTVTVGKLIQTLASLVTYVTLSRGPETQRVQSLSSLVLSRFFSTRGHGRELRFTVVPVLVILVCTAVLRALGALGVRDASMQPRVHAHVRLYFHSKQARRERAGCGLRSIITCRALGLAMALAPLWYGPFCRLSMATHTALPAP